MKTKYLLAIFPLLSFTMPTYSQSGGNFIIDEFTIDNGGGRSLGGDFSLQGTIGQADASTEVSGGNFSLKGGFWPSSFTSDLIFEDGFEVVLRLD
jgi:hypothetical protein